MDRYRSLYKGNSSMLSPAQHNRTNRELHNANRAKKRRQIFENGRNIDISPTPKNSMKSEEQAIHLDNENFLPVENKENKGEVVENLKSEVMEIADQTECNKSRIALVASGKVNSKKATRQEVFLLKFIQWKEAHKQKELKRNEPKKRPFVSSCGAGSGTFGGGARPPTVKSKVKSKEVASFVPKDHHKFQPPVGLQIPAALKNSNTPMTSAAKDALKNDRKSFYTVVPTPPKIKPGNATKDDYKKPSALSITPAVSNLSRANLVATPAVTAVKSTKTNITKSVSTKCVKASAITNTTKPTAVIAPSKKVLQRALTYPGTATALAVAPQKTTLNVDYKSSSKDPLKKNETQAVNRLNSATKFVRPQAPKKTTAAARKPMPHAKGYATSAKEVVSKTGVTGTNTGAVGKAHQLQSKRAKQVAECPITQRNAKLATNFKAKKTQVSTLSRHKAPSKFTIKGKTLLGSGARSCTADTAFAIAETPTDLLNINPFEPFVTSTRVKSLSPHTSNAPNISQVSAEVVQAKIEPVSQENIRAHSTSSAKRALLQNSVKQKLPNKIQRKTTKYNFVRYSVGLSELDTSAEAEPNSLAEEEAEKVMYDGKLATEQMTVVEVHPKVEDEQGDLTMVAESKIDHDLAQLKTPISGDAERPVNYIGSFVSVSRGKGSARKEREKRDSIYVPGANSSLLATTATTTPIRKLDAAACQVTVATPVSIEARRILEAVRYFRQQLSNEIERLHALCDQWEVYKQQNLSLLQQTGGEDMVNVTIGQTKLLTSKKFQQFKGLIDRCENGARGTAAANDGSEDTKPISDVDLEGFWSMLNLQVDNVEKRFENLARWKSNNWSDPDEFQQTKQVKHKSKQNLTRVKKIKAPAKTAKTAKASSGLQAMLRKMHSEMRKNKETAATTGTDIDVAMVLTPTRQRQRRSHSGTPKIGATSEAEHRNSTPRHISVVVRDRKSLSAAATVVCLPADSTVVAAVAAQRRLSRANADSPMSFKACSNELRRSLSNMEKAFGGCNDLLRHTLAGNSNKSRRRSGTPNFVELPIDEEVKQESAQALAKVRTPSPTPTPAAGIARKSILKTPGTAKGRPKNVNFSEKMRVKKFKFTLKDDDESSGDEEQRLQTSTEEPLVDAPTYSLRTRKVVLRPSSEFEIPIRQ